MDNNFVWPDWVPDAIRKEVERFWSGCTRDWKRSEMLNKAPELGSVVSLRKVCEDTMCAPGRFVFVWNNIGRVVHEDGTFDYVAFESPQHNLW